ncbi:phosphoprotein phosphatase : Calcineurin-like phosphoesterase OS=Microvirga lotononidis GN=MicloDRAFT_00032980 PE=4 SV=1: Metallophos [Gemmataceae bacterium]|nr:phosphoprotein phosphatase : Calcineurin-like phosphoesterase OS=Microvirga lotononidis GN=MicloDRAFT_00032980 PE=4 SV=1: Metallophos [Gemmataceae bacterium]VTT96668.1 phosphoprotein phosphatase : Calcineurin-like phosphoesterase OS=Microvirga lotononidis GN=MicloDRAFT_00032980 PE=4 SV=1: Metallophos [Gemmataceae bacterium]
MLDVVTAADFPPLTLEEAMGRARATRVSDVRGWLADPANARRLLFDDARTDCPEVAILTPLPAPATDDTPPAEVPVVVPLPVPDPLWIIGDVHADVLALATAIEYASRVSKHEGREPSFVFLGDFIDRGPHDHETLLLLFGLVMKHPERVCVIPGNHDVDLRWGEKAQRFGVSIQPAEYCERLNELLDADPSLGQEEVQLARLAIEFWKGRPKAVFLPDGTALSHGGFPHTDLHDALRTRADLGAKRCLDDFLWARLSESVKKRPNRGNRGHEFGSRDFAQFCQVMGREGLGVPLRRLIRGHDHVAERWQLPDEYRDFPVVTINAMGWRMDGELVPADGPHPSPVIARHVPGGLPRIVRLRLDPAELDRSLGREPEPPESGPSVRGPEPATAEIPPGPATL